jgi:ABC-type sugar transport system ATPase subunit
LKTTPGGLVRDRVQWIETTQLLRRFGLDVPADQWVETLPVAQQQLVEIAKALSLDARVIVMDEPTSALNAPEVERLFELIHQLKSKGCGIVYITHKMEEIQRIGDRITVLRDGRWIGTAPAVELPVPKLIHWMVGREVEQQYPRHEQHVGAERLRMDRFSVRRGKRRLVDNVSLTIRAGEIVGLAGLQGSGNSDLLTGLFGAHGVTVSGTVELDDRRFVPGSPRRSISQGIALLTNDRKATGLVLSMSVVANTTLTQLERFSPGGWRRAGQERLAAATMAEALNLRAASLEMVVGELSGGNQQKVALAKWILTNPKVLLLDEPTRGVDVGAKREIYALMDQWTAAGIAIVLVTSEMPELLAMSDRIVVMHRGQVTAQFDRGQASAELVLEAAMGRRIRVVQP